MTEGGSGARHDYRPPQKRPAAASHTLCKWQPLAALHRRRGVISPALCPGARLQQPEPDHNDGRTLQRVQYYDNNKNRPQARIRLVLGWDDPQAEVDMRVNARRPACLLGRPILSEGGGLDPTG